MIALLLLSLALPVPAATTIPTDLEIEIHQLINEERANKASHGIDLVPLELQSTLISVARKHSQDMLDNNYFAHENLQGEDVSDRVGDAGITFTAVGENLFTASGYQEGEIAAIAVEGWIESPGHYANILTDFRYTGIGIASQGSTYYITQVFLNAQRGHLEEVGRIYDNDNLDNLTPEQEESGFFSNISISPQLAAGIFVMVMILIGLDAGRRNNRSRQSRYRRF